MKETKRILFTYLNFGYFAPYVRRGRVNTCTNSLFTFSCINLQGVPRNMTVGEWFRMSSSKYYIRYLRLFQFISSTHSFIQIYFTLKSTFYKMAAMFYLLLFSFVSKNLTNYGRRHLKLSCFVGPPVSGNDTICTLENM